MSRKNTRWEVAAAAAAFGAGVGALGRAVTLVAGRRRRRHEPAREDGWYVAHRAVTVDRPLDEVAAAWRDPRLLSRVAGQRIRLESLDGRRWACLHDDGGVAWRAAVTMDNSRHVLRWRGTGGTVPHEGEAWFAPAPMGRGTEVRVVLRYAPAGRIPAADAVWEPDRRMREALRRFKSVLECGEVLGSGPYPRDVAAVQAPDVAAAKTPNAPAAAPPDVAGAGRRLPVPGRT